MRFMVLMIPAVYQREVQDGFAPPADAVAEMGKFNQRLEDAGVLRSLDGLHPPTRTKSARVTFTAKGKPVVTDGPFAETREVLGGYWIIEVASREAAIEWMRQCPAEPGDTLEIRQIFEASDFGQ